MSSRRLPTLMLWGAAFLLLIAACGGSTDSSPEATLGDTEFPPTTAGPVADDRELAPDFSLPLGDGTTYHLASDPNPVFMVFWAEW